MTIPIDRILVALDGSDHALAAMRFATRLAEALAAELVLLHVVELEPAEAVGLAGAADTDVEAFLRRKAEGVFGRAGEAIGELHAALRIREIVELGHPARTIVSVAAREDADLIVMGSRGMGPLRELLLGSTSEQVIRRAARPVTVVH